MKVTILRSSALLAAFCILLASCGGEEASPNTKESTPQADTVSSIDNQPKEEPTLDKPRKPEFLICEEKTSTDIASIEKNKRIADELSLKFTAIKQVCNSPFLSLTRAPEATLSGMGLYQDFKSSYCFFPDYKRIKEYLSSNEFINCSNEYDALKDDLNEKIPKLIEQVKNILPTQSYTSDLPFILGSNINSLIEKHPEFYIYSGSFGKGSTEYPIKKWAYPSKKAEASLDIEEMSLKIGYSNDGTINGYVIQTPQYGISYNQFQKECINRVDGLYAHDTYFEVPRYQPIHYKDTRTFISNESIHTVSCNYVPNYIETQVTRVADPKSQSKLLNHIATYQYVQNVKDGSNKVAKEFLDKAIAQERHNETVKEAEDYLWSVRNICPSPFETLKQGSYAAPGVYQIAYNSENLKDKVALIEDKNLKGKLDFLTDDCITEMYEIKRQISKRMTELENTYSNAMINTSEVKFALFGYLVGSEIPEGVKFSSTGFRYKNYKEYAVTDPSVSKLFKERGNLKATIYLEENNYEIKRTKLYIDYRPFGKGDHCAKVSKQLSDELDKLGYFKLPSTSLADEYLGKNTYISLQCNHAEAEFTVEKMQYEKPSFFNIAVKSLTQ